MWNVTFALIVRTSSVLLFPDMGKKEFFCQCRLLLKGDAVCSAFHGMETPFTEPVLRDQRQVIGSSPARCRRILGGKNSRVAFLTIDVFGLMSSLSWKHVAYKSLPNSHWWCLGRGRFAQVVWMSYVLLIPEVERKDFSYQIRLLISGEYFGVAFKPSKLPAAIFCSERMTQHMCIWAILPGNI